MMKKFLLLFLVVSLSLSTYAQISVKEGSFKEVPGFVNINTEKMYDDNDRPYAVLKIKTENISSKERHELSFKGDAQTFFEVEYKDGEVWLYISYYATYIKISHEEFSSTEFHFPFDMKPKCGYELTLVNNFKKEGEKEIYNYLIIKADQHNASIYIDDVFVGEKECAKPFKANEKHTWRIECEFYHNESGETIINDKAGANTIIDRVLRPAYGFLNVTSSPEIDAIVYIDGKRVGQTPYKSKRLASGEHKIKVMKEMFFPCEQTFTVTDGDTIEATMEMRANFVNVIITTDSKSKLYIDNEFKARGRWSGRLSKGEHSFEARKPSHKTSIKNVHLELGKDETIVIPDPEPIYGTLDIKSSPMGAAIFIDYDSLGVTPTVLNNVIIGEHLLQVSWKGDDDYVYSNIKLSEDEKLSINAVLLKEPEEVADDWYEESWEVVESGQYDPGQREETIVIPDLEPIYGTLFISSNPTGADIYIDDVCFGTTPKELTNVNIGEHFLVLRYHGDYDYVNSSLITLNEDEKLLIHAVLYIKEEAMDGEEDDPVPAESLDKIQEIEITSEELEFGTCFFRSGSAIIEDTDPMRRIINLFNNDVINEINEYSFPYITISIEVWVAPGRDESHDLKLSEDRAISLGYYIRAYLGEQYESVDVEFETVGNGADWDGFYNALNKSSIQEKSIIAEAIMNAEDKNAKLDEMRVVYPELNIVLESLNCGRLRIDLYY